MPGLVNTGNFLSIKVLTTMKDQLFFGFVLVPSPLLESKKNAFFVQIHCIHFTVAWISHKNINPLVG